MERWSLGDITQHTLATTILCAHTTKVQFWQAFADQIGKHPWDCTVPMIAIALFWRFGVIRCTRASTFYRARRGMLLNLQIVGSE